MYRRTYRIALWKARVGVILWIMAALILTLMSLRNDALAAFFALVFIYYAVRESRHYVRLVAAHPLGEGLLVSARVCFPKEHVRELLAMEGVHNVTPIASSGRLARQYLVEVDAKDRNRVAALLSVDPLIRDVTIPPRLPS